MTDNIEARILLIDPDPASCDELVENVRRGGYAAVGVRNVNEAISYLGAHEVPRVILLGANGVAGDHDRLGAELRANPEWAWIPVIVLSEEAAASKPVGFVMRRSEGTARLLSVVSRAVVLQKLR